MFYAIQIDDAGTRRVAECYSTAEACARAVARLDERVDADALATAWSWGTDGTRYEIGMDDE